MAQINPATLEADYAITLRPSGTDTFQTRDLNWIERAFEWTGWKRSMWPADVIAPGLHLYGFDLRKEERQLFVLLSILKGGRFSFRSMQEFAETVASLIGHQPAPEDDDYSRKKWTEIANRLEKNRGEKLYGICYTLKVIKPVAIPLPGEYPQLGWCNLRLPNYGMKIGEEKEV
jgi:hypothetical protein